MAATSPPAYSSLASGQFVAKDHVDGKFHLLLAASGSVATIKIPNIISFFANRKDISIRLILTRSAAEFLQGQSSEQPSLGDLAQYPNVDAIYGDEDEWRVPWTRGAPILHIELRRWADLLLIAPLSANTLAKLSNGLCDNLLTSVVRAWEVLPAGDPSQRLVMIAPAMNTFMWRHPLTAEHLARLATPFPKQPSYSWVRVIRPIEKELACGDTGDGAMADIASIIVQVEHQLISSRQWRVHATTTAAAPS